MKRGALIVGLVVGLLVFLFLGGRQVVSKRTLRLNNPLALRPLPGGVKWKGELEPESLPVVGSMSRFDLPVNGWRAGTIDTLGKIKRGTDTIAKLVLARSPHSDGNDPDGYAKTVARRMGLAVDYPLNIYLHGPALVHELAKYEAGEDPDETWGEAVRLDGYRQGLAYVVERYQ